jgi:thioredoxin reductase
MTTFSKHIYKFAIVGSGPSGLYFYHELKNKLGLKDNDIKIFERNALCSNIETYGKFVENRKSSKSKKWDFLVSGKYCGKDVANYFINKFPVNCNFSGIKKITKVLHVNNYILVTNNGEEFYANNVVLATGLRPRDVPALHKNFSEKFDCTNWHRIELANIDFSKHEIIFIGSGDNVLFKSMNLAKSLMNKYKYFPNPPITILVKKNIDQDTNPLFRKAVQSFVKKNIIKIVDDCWDIKKVNLNKYGFITQVVAGKNRYTVKAPDGAYTSVYIGNEANIPLLENCDINNLVCIGDLRSWLDGKVCSITDALENVRDIVDKLKTSQAD